MKKYIIFLLTVLSVLAVLSGCAESDNGKQETGGPESYYVYGLLEECSDSEKYCTVQTMEITSSYPAGEDTNTDGSGYYVVVGVDTDLTVGELTKAGNRVQLGLSGSQIIDLEFLKFDEEGKNLIFEVPQADGLDYSELCNLKASDSEAEFPFLSIFLEYFDRYCTVDGENYVGRYFLLILE